jgi:HD-GYP domain-containing protein (c-di-GMP phosphodiesterase class II)
MAVALGLPVYEITKLKMVALLHDIGKVVIDENILNKPGMLTDSEWVEIKRHSEMGYRILSAVNDMAEVAGCVLSHHERWDGLGYPKGLKEEQIPLMSRIIAIARVGSFMHARFASALCLQ